LLGHLLKKTKYPTAWRLDDRDWPVILRQRAGTKRITMRVCGMTDTLRVSAPPRCSAKGLIQVLEEHTAVLTVRARELPPRKAFIPGAELPFLDGILHLRHEPGRRTSWEEIDGGYILTVGGQPEHFPRRVRDAIRKRCELLLRESCATAFDTAAHSYNLRPLKKISLQNAGGRWGSCAPDGTLRFSWRLVFAPRWILDYVAAHEVAHLAEMSHSPRFWAVVETITPDARKARAWLQRYGSQIHRIGPAI